MYIAVFFLSGLMAGLIIGIFGYMFYLQKKTIKQQEIAAQVEIQKQQERDRIIEQIREVFGSLSAEVLNNASTNLIKLANEVLAKQTQSGIQELDKNKHLIDQTLINIKTELLKVQEHINNTEKDRVQKYGELSQQIKFTADQTSKLQDTTNRLTNALTNSRVRGQWGERMAEDILRLAGLVEGINYRKQNVDKDTSEKPDYTFFLPNGFVVNMDVKFPLDNYLKYLDEEDEDKRNKYKDIFIQDVKKHIRTMTSRGYINKSENTVDYMIIFIPNEQVYGFINEKYRTILDEALKQKIILCSPLTLYAILSVIRQSVDNFNLEQTTSEILRYMQSFAKQWDEFFKAVEKIGKGLDSLQKDYGVLITTRKNQIEKPLLKIQNLAQQKGILAETNDSHILEFNNESDEKNEFV